MLAEINETTRCKTYSGGVHNNRPHKGYEELPKTFNSTEIAVRVVHLSCHGSVQVVYLFCHVSVHLVYFY